MTIKVALAGNPNCGKTTMFNKLTGSSQRVGNWPGVTIDRKEGKLKKETDVSIVDLPGIYSLSPYSPEEIVSRNFLVHDRPDAIINIVDASNIERNLYLTTQILEFGIPTVIALNMMDVVKNEGITIDVAKLSKELGCRIIETTALKGEGLDELRTELMAAIAEKKVAKPIAFSGKVEDYISQISDIIRGKVPEESLRWYAIKLLEKDEKVHEEIDDDKIDSIVESFEKEFDDEADGIITDERYSAINKITTDCIKKPEPEDGEVKMTLSDKIDKVVTNRWLGLPIFFLIMVGVYYVSVQTLGAWATDWINDDVFGVWMEDTAGWFADQGVNETLSGLVVDGIMAGVFAVLGFLPQMLLLFFILVILEECGYMARVAFVMDRIFRRFGLSGKSFIPVLIGTGCGVPGIMASRTIESERDRKITAMTVTFVPCGAKLPVIALIAGALFSGSALVAVAIYFIGIFCVLLSGLILKKWRSLSGTPTPFIMELPMYHCPTVRNVVLGTLTRAWAFVKKAGTFILLACVIVWFLASFSWNLTLLAPEDIDQSILASIGNAFRYLFVPLGWGDDWELSVATITGLLAKENIVGTFGTIFGIEEISEAGEEVWETLKTMLTPLAGFSFLLFNMLCAPCFAAIGAMRRELGTWKATGFAVLYQCMLAYAVALIVFQFGSIFTEDGISGWLIFAIAVLAILIYLLVAKDPFKFLDKEKTA